MSVTLVQSYRVHVRTSKGSRVSETVHSYAEAQAAVASMLEWVARTTNLRVVEFAVEKFGETSTRKVRYGRKSTKATTWTAI